MLDELKDEGMEITEKHLAGIYGLIGANHYANHALKQQ